LIEPKLDTVEVETGIDPQLGIIWLHGLGADGHDFEPIAAELALPFAVRFVFPHAPVRAVTINNGMRMRAWFDIRSLSRNADEDEASIRTSAELVTELVDREIERGLVSDRIVVAGFSQGGALALHVGLREPRRLAGVLALSAFLPLAATLPAEKASANLATPIFMAHGMADPVIDITLAQQSLAYLRRQAYAPLWKTYPMEHAVCVEELRDIGAWLASLPAASD